MKAKFKDLQFKNKREFNKWLKETATQEISLQDNGQDLLKIWIAPSGEILHCNMQSAVWNGTFVKLPLAIGEPLQMKNKYLGRGFRTMDFVVESIKTCNEVRLINKRQYDA